MAPTNYFSRLFGRSPVRPLQEHMSRVLAAVQELVPFSEAVIAKDWDQARIFQKRIAGLEDEADGLKKDLRMHLPKGIMLPFPRRDALEVLSMQDKVANTARDVAGLMIGRRMEIPPSVASIFVALVRRCVDACAQANKAINELDELVETGFEGGEVEVVTAMLQELDDIEADTDRLQVELRAGVFAIEKDLPPVDVMFLYRVIELVGDLGDRAQRVGSRLQLMLAK